MRQPAEGREGNVLQRRCQRGPGDGATVLQSSVVKWGCGTNGLAGSEAMEFLRFYPEVLR